MCVCLLSSEGNSKSTSMKALHPQDVAAASSSTGPARLPPRRCCCVLRSAVTSTQRHSRRRSAQPSTRPVLCMGIRAVETYDGAFQLADSSEQHLRALLSSKSFCDQVCGERRVSD